MPSCPSVLEVIIDSLSDGSTLIVACMTMDVGDVNVDEISLLVTSSNGNVDGEYITDVRFSETDVVAGIDVIRGALDVIARRT